MRKILFIPLILLFCFPLYSGEETVKNTSVKVEASILPAKSTVGTVLNYTITLKGQGAGDLNVHLPSEKIFIPEKTEGESESAGSVPLYIIGEASRKDSLESETPVSEINMAITYYRTGEYNLPQLKITDNAGNEYSYNPPVVNIESINREGSLADIESPLDLSGNYTRLFMVIIALCLSAVMVFLIIRYFKNRKKYEITEIKEKSPYEIFMDEIERKDPASFISMGEVKKYVFTMSILFRKYISLLYSFDAGEMTTWEISRILGSVMPEDVYGRYSSDIIEIMNFWDLSKFAEFAPSQELLENNFKSTLDVAGKLFSGGEVSDV